MDNHAPTPAIDDEPPVAFILFSHEFPSGDVPGLLRRLHRSAKLPRHYLLARYLRECTSVLRQEVQKLPRQQREAIPPFKDFAELASQWEQLRCCSTGGAWEGAFVCIYEMAMLLGYHEANHIPYHPKRDGGFNAACLGGISIGLFSAAAIAVSASLTDLVHYGAEAARVAFVFCAHVGRTSQLLETALPEETTTSPVSWASVVIGVPAEVIQTELDRFNGQILGELDTMTTPLTQVSISHIDSASVGITGPPARLAELFRQSRILNASRHAPLPISGGLCHCPNVYDADDVQAILETAGALGSWGAGSIQLPLLSPHTGAPFPATDGYRLIEAICTEALSKPLYFDKIAEGVVKHISSNPVLNDAPSCRILHYRTSIISDTIISSVTDKLSPTRVVCQDLLDWVMQDIPTFYQPCGMPQDSKLAVVGMACRMPDADNPDQFWDLLMEGRDTHAEVPADRFDLDAHFDPSMQMENAVGTRFGNFVSNPGLFDAGFFNMTPREAQQTDPMQRLALVTAYEALEMAGFVPNRTPSSHVSRTGTYYGQASDDYREVNASLKIGTYGITGTERAFGNGRINYFFDFQGPSFNVDTACSSGLAAVHAACSALWAGDADTVVAGGLNVITNPDIYCMLGKGHFLSQTGQCKVWDARADGYCRGDGVGSVVIKRLEDAIEDNDHILATIVAGATNHSSESVSITQPHAGVQKDNYQQVMNQAGVSPLDVNFVELHGTGTQVGDAIESESVLSFFAPVGQRQHPEQRLHLGAVKSNIGHGEAAAGVASLIKVLLMYRHGKIPRHVGIQTTVNPVVAQHLANRNAGVASGNTAWLPMPDKATRYSIVNSFGAHGGNTTLLLEDAPWPSCTKGEEEDTATTSAVICVSAKSKASLRGNVSALLRYVDAHPEIRLKDLAYTTCARRMHHHIRIAASVSSTEELRSFLQAAAGDVDAHAEHVSTATPEAVVFAFSGQGCFYRGAATQLFEKTPFFRDQVLQLDRVVRQLGFPSVLTAIANVDVVSPSGSTSSSDGDRDYNFAASIDSTSTDSVQAAVESPIVTQLALVVLQIALTRYWGLLGIVPKVVIGHSLGEYAALVMAEVLSVADALFLVGKRAELMTAACTPGSHTMLSVRGASADRVSELCHASGKEYDYEVSCFNGRADIVLSGTEADMIALRDMLQGVSGLKCAVLDIPFAFHSAQLKPILDDFQQAARRVTFKAPRIPVVSPLLGQCISEGQIINGTYLRRATREPVDFVSGMNAAAAEGLIDGKSTWIDISPHPVCSSFARNFYEDRTVRTLATMRKGEDNLATLTGSLAALHSRGVPIAWTEYFAPHEKSHRLLHLDSYHWNQKNYWIPYEGTWTLDKAHAGLQKSEKVSASPAFLTSSVQQVIFEEFQGTSSGRMTALSDLTHPDLVGAAAGHKINGRSVITGSIWADIALTVGDYLFKRMVPDAGRLYMDVKDMKVAEAKVLHEEASASTPAQMIRIEGALDMSRKESQVSLFSANADGTRTTDRAFATATVCYEDAQTWHEEWQMTSHLVAARAAALWKGAPGEGSLEGGIVSKLSRSTVYQLFANVVDYGTRYRGMHQVALAEGNLEAAADILLDIDRHGTWHTPPHWIDSTFQVAGLVMNSFGVQGDGKSAGSSRDYFYITPGWRHFRLAEPLEAGPDMNYRNYVRMFPVEGELGAFAGDIYLLRGEKVIGVCAGIKFKRVPRALMPTMFPRRQSREQGGKRHDQGVPPVNAISSPSRMPSQTSPAPILGGPSNVKPPPVSTVSRPQQKERTSPTQIVQAAPLPVEATPPVPAADGQKEDPRVDSCLQLIADETGLDLEELSDSAAFAELGVDSLLSITISEKMRVELGIQVKPSIFLECTTIRDLVEWIDRHAA